MKKAVKKRAIEARFLQDHNLSMSLAALILTLVVPSSHAIARNLDAPCEQPLKQIELKMQVAAENLAAAPQPALPGMWPIPRKSVVCSGEQCKVVSHRGVKLSYQPYSFYSDDLGLVGYPDIDVNKESSELASLEWQYDLEAKACKKDIEAAAVTPRHI